MADIHDSTGATTTTEIYRYQVPETAGMWMREMGLSHADLRKEILARPIFKPRLAPKPENPGYREATACRKCGHFGHRVGKRCRRAGCTCEHRVD